MSNVPDNLPEQYNALLGTLIAMLSHVGGSMKLDRHDMSIKPHDFQIAILQPKDEPEAVVVSLVPKQENADGGHESRPTLH